MIGIGEAVGIIAAQSIGEPGTQLTMRTFHTGGVAGQDITQGLPRVEELFEARIPKGKAEISHIDGIVEVISSDTGRKVKVTSREAFDTPIELPVGAELLAAPGDLVELNQVLARSEASGDVSAPVKGFLARTDLGVVVRAEDVVEREYTIPHSAKLLVEDGSEIRAGDAITDGPINPQEYLDVRGKDAVQRYLVREVQRVYRSQGVTINDKHVEIIVRQMLKKVRIDQPGDLEQLPTELIDRLDFEEANNKVLSEGGEPATAQTVLLGVTKASLNTSSFLAAASFQETTRVLTEAAINGARDHLIGLKENVIIGKLIPAGTGAPQNIAALKERQRRAALEALAGEAIEGLGEAEYNPFLEDGTRPVDDETAGLALAATIAGKDEDEAEFNPFAATRSSTVATASGRGRRGRAAEEAEFNPFLAETPRSAVGLDTARSRRAPGAAGGLFVGGRPAGPVAAWTAPDPTFDTQIGRLLHFAAVASKGLRSPWAPETRPQRVPNGPRPDPRHGWTCRARTTTDQTPRTKGAASPCRPSASSCATGESRRSPRSRPPRCARTGTACGRSSCRSPAPPRSGASACRCER